MNTGVLQSLCCSADFIHMRAACGTVETSESISRNAFMHANANSLCRLIEAGDSLVCFLSPTPEEIIFYFLCTLPQKP